MKMYRIPISYNRIFLFVKVTMFLMVLFCIVTVSLYMYCFVALFLKPCMLAAHQGVSAMERRARVTFFWSGITQDINNIRNSCVHCNRNAPSRQLSHRCPSTRPQLFLRTFFPTILITVGAIFW